MYYLIDTILRKCSAKECHEGKMQYMPELDSVWGYPAVIIISVLIVILSLLFFKHRKWL